MTKQNTPQTSYWHPDGMRIGDGGHFVEVSEYRKLLVKHDALLEAAKVCETWLESPPYTESDKHVCRQSLVKLRSAIADAEKTTD